MSTIAASTHDQAYAVTVSDSTADPAGPFTGLFVAVAGTLKFTTANGVAIALTAAPVGHINIRVSRVWSTGTGATVFGLKSA